MTSKLRNGPQRGCRCVFRVSALGNLCLLSDLQEMPDDVLIDFYLASVKVQAHEYHLCGSNLPEEHASVRFS